MLHMADWDARQYHRISQPQQEWGQRVLDRLTLRGDEDALDVGCGTGHLTARLAARLPRGTATALDPSAAMVQQAARWLATAAPDVRLLRADGMHLPFVAAFDVVFSTATFHWIHDHDRLFASIHAALRPAGRLHAQCGGGPNLARLYGRARQLVAHPRFEPFFAGWNEPWNFQDVGATRARLRTAGFVDADASLEEAPTHFNGEAEYVDFVRVVCLKPFLERLPPSQHGAFVQHLAAAAAADDPPFTLDYWRLNIAARRAAA
jgi:trans-aconitate 2-methyltransferase